MVHLVSLMEFRFIEEIYAWPHLGENFQRTFFLTEGISPTLAPSRCSPVTPKESSASFSSVCLLLLLLYLRWRQTPVSVVFQRGLSTSRLQQLPDVQQQRLAEGSCFRGLSNQQSLWRSRTKPAVAGLSSPYCASQSHQSLLNAYILYWLGASKGPFLMHFPI